MLVGGLDAGLKPRVPAALTAPLGLVDLDQGLPGTATRHRLPARLDRQHDHPPFAPGGITKLDAARNAMAAMNDLIEAQLPGSRAALVSFQGGNTPAYNTTQAVRVLSNLTTDFDSVDAAAASIDVNTINPNSTTALATPSTRREMLLAQGNFQSLPVVISMGDGWANIDYAGNGPLAYRFPVM